MGFLVAFVLAVASVAQATFWMADIQHRGRASFNPDKSYAVFRNVQDFGARGDGVADDTAAVNAAISSGSRCGGGYSCVGSTLTPAVVYFPPGTYLISNPIVDYYYTQIIGDPNDMPVLKGTSSFPSTANGLLDADPYLDNGFLNFKSTDVFFRQVRNLVFDTTDIPGTVNAIHWPSAQATSIQNCVFRLSTRPGNNHTGIFMEEGSGGLMNDLVFYGGEYGARFGNQQYTMRNLTFYGSRTAILQIWNWGWTYKSLNFINCDVGINMSTADVGSLTLLDSKFINVSKALVTGRNPGNTTGRGSLMVENVEYTFVPTVLEGPGEQVLLLGDPSGTVYDLGYARGNLYAPQGPELFEGRNPSYFYQPPSLKIGNKYYERSKPQYESHPSSAFLSARGFGAAGDGVTDDTAALNSLFLAVSTNNSAIAFLDAGFYKVSDTVYVPANTRIVGEALAAVIMGTGAKYSDSNSPYPVVKIGMPGEIGWVEMSDIIVSTQGAAAGAVLIEYNLNTPAAGADECSAGGRPSGLWDVHVRVGGFAGSGLQLADCPTTPDKTNFVDLDCVAAYMSIHITKTAANLYVENSWLWVADHDLEDYNSTQISVFAGRGLLVEGSRVWLVATAVEHHALYQYQLVNASDVWMGQIQTETPYYQPNPPAPYPFYQRNTDLWDPDFDVDCRGYTGYDGSDIAAAAAAAALTGPPPPCAMAWGLRVLGSRNVVVFGAGLYSFFHNYNTTCSTTASGESCQARIFSVGPFPVEVTVSETGSESGGNATATAVVVERDSAAVGVYNLNTVGSVSMVTREGADLAFWHENFATFASTLAVFRF
ncbi:pectate lyase superfamily protein-domain-containing protein [Lasiosphaeria ovina]|uniref:Pectate lyase superfamily protein-domain-containing protein n=1 Tax=Lasiosphaeria ovina TaxID=92902 RepID=A0AAE0JZJ5_9PEZI|nr:pectate lyase superfamily protein-domain-containing protein [Lasiosphaeria ovina]